MSFQNRVAVPDTSANMTVSAVPLSGFSSGVTGYMTMQAIGTATVWVLWVNYGSTPSAQTVVDNGAPIIPGIPLSVQDPETSPDPSRYFLATASGDGAGDVAVIS